MQTRAPSRVTSLDVRVGCRETRQLLCLRSTQDAVIALISDREINFSIVNPMAAKQLFAAELMSSLKKLPMALRQKRLTAWNALPLFGLAQFHGLPATYMQALV